MWMWSLKTPPFLGIISPRLSQSAVRLRTRWLQRQSPSQEPEPKVAVEASSAAGVPHRVQRLQRKATQRNVRLVAQSAASFPAPPSGASAAASASASAGDSVAGRSAGSASEQDLAVDLTVDLDYAPSLGPCWEVLCVLLPVLLVALLYVAGGQWHRGSWLAAVGSAVLAAALGSLTRTALLERAYKARERAFATLGDGDSHFRPISTAAREEAAAAGSDRRLDPQLLVHVKVKVGDLSQPSPYDGHGVRDVGRAADGSGAVGASGGGGLPPSRSRESVPAVHCYHGFGANLGSYKRVQEELAAVLRGVVTAHDMPGFGLTQRPSDISSYFLTFNGRLGRLVMEYELQQLGLGPHEAAGAQRQQLQLQQERVDPPAVTTAPGGTAAAGNGVASSIKSPPLGVAAVAAAPGGGGGGGVTGGGGGPGGAVPGAVVMAVRSAEAGGHSVEQQQQQEQRTQGQAGGAAPKPPPIKRILVGHSLGGACASLEAVTNPEGLAGLVLVAPAVVALPGAEYKDVSLAPDRPAAIAAGGGGGGGGTAAAAAAAATAAEQLRAAAARAAAHLGSQPPGSHVTDPPEVRRLYPVGQMPTAGQARGAAGGAVGGGGRAGSRLGAVLRALRSLAVAAASLALLTVLRLLTPVITLLLRSLVRRRTFWVKGLQQAYYNPGAVTPDIVDAYRLPQLVSGWEAGMVNFLLARLTQPRAGLGGVLRQVGKQLEPPSTATILAATAAAAAADAKAEAASAIKLTSCSAAAAVAGGGGTGDDGDLASRLAALVASRGLPVLIIHGLYDRLVPASNSQRLARMLPGCELVLLDRCGHMPQEELPYIFVDLVAEFAARVAPRGGR